MPRSKNGKFVTNPFTGDPARLKTPNNIRAPPKDTEEFDRYYRPGPSRPTQLSSEYSRFDSRRSHMASVHDADEDDISPRTETPVRRHDWAAQPAVKDFGNDMDFGQARVAYEDNHDYPGAYPRTPYQHKYDVSPLGEDFDQGRKASVITTFPGASFDKGRPEPAKREFAGSPEKLRADGVDPVALRNGAKKAIKEHDKRNSKPTVVRMFHFMKKAPKDEDAHGFLFTRNTRKKMEKYERQRQGLAPSAMLKPVQKNETRGKGKARAVSPEQSYGYYRAQPTTIPSDEQQEKVRDQNRDDSITSMELPFAVSKSVQYDAQQTYVDMFKHKELPYVPAGAIPGTSLGPQAREKIPRKRDNLPPSPPPPMVPLKVKNSKKGKEKSHEEQHAPFTPPHIRHFPAQSQEKRYVTLEDIQALKPNRKNPSPEKDHTREHGGSAWLSRTASHFKVPSEVHGKADANGKKKNLKDMISGPIGGAILEATTYEGNAPLRRTETHGRAPKGKQPETSMQRSTNRRPGPQQVEQFPDPKKRPTWKHFKEQYKDAKEATHFDQARVDKHDNYTPRGPYDRRGPSLSDQDLVKPKHRFAPPPIDTTLANDLVPRPLNVKSGMAQRRRSASEVTTRDTRRPSRRLKKRGHSVSYSASWDIVP